MSVDTNTKGKNLAPYRRVRPAEGVEVLLAHDLQRHAVRLALTSRRGVLGKRLDVVAERSGACEI